MSNRRWTLLLAVLLTLGLVAAACGSDDDDSDSATATTAAADEGEPAEDEAEQCIAQRCLASIETEGDQRSPVEKPAADDDRDGHDQAGEQRGRGLAVSTIFRQSDRRPERAHDRDRHSGEQQ